MNHVLKMVAMLSALQSCGKSPGSNPLIYGGEEISAKKFPSVVRIKHGENSCSGTFIKNNVLITAAHCVLSESTPRPRKDGTVPNESISLADSPNVASKEIFAYPVTEFSPTGTLSTKDSSMDIAVVFFSEDYSHVFSEIASKSVKEGDAVEFVGFGYPNLGKKQLGKNTVQSVTKESAIITGSDNGFTDDEHALLGPGDSGGPMFYENKVVGVASAGSAYDSIHANLTSAKLRKFLKKWSLVK